MNILKIYPVEYLSIIFSILFLCLTPKVLGDDSEIIKEIESAVSKTDAKNFEGDAFLLQKIGDGNNATGYYANKNGFPVFVRDKAGAEDSGKDVIVLEAHEGRLINYKARNIYVVLIRNKKGGGLLGGLLGGNKPQNAAYFIAYAYARGAMPSDGKNTLTIGGKKLVIEIDNFNFRDHKGNRAKVFGHVRCIESIFTPCKTDEPPKYNQDSKSIPPNDTVQVDTQPDKKLNLKDNNFFFDLEMTDSTEKMVGEVINLFTNLLFDMNEKDIPNSKMDVFLDSLSLIGKYRLGLGVKDKDDHTHLGFNTIKGILENTENNGGVVSPNKLINIKVLEGYVKKRDKKGGIAGRFAGDDYEGDYGEDEEAAKPKISLDFGKRKRSPSGNATNVNNPDDSYDYSSKEEKDEKDYNVKPANISLRLGRSNHQNIKSDNDDEIAGDSDVDVEKRATPGKGKGQKQAAGPEKKQVGDFKIDSDLFTHLGWTTMDYENADLSKAADLQALPFIGFGNCPYQSVEIGDVEKLENAQSATEFYLKLLRMDCKQIVKADIAELISSKHLSFENNIFSVPSSCPGLNAVKLSKKETDQFGRAFMLASLSKTLKESHTEKFESPDGKPIPGHTAILVKMALNAVDDVKALSPTHVIVTIRRLATTLISGFTKVLQDLYRLKNCKDCDSTLETNGAMVLLTAFHFITQDMPILGVTPKKAGEMFPIYFKKNAAAMSARFANYLPK